MKNQEKFLRNESEWQKTDKNDFSFSYISFLTEEKKQHSIERVLFKKLKLMIKYHLRLPRFHDLCPRW